ncbi:pro-resilin-like isoform X1 [Pieris napi]|uniref:pro-resilin-like isoform X1 n=1 Tax=Pieris napi TaxID=78633 RepID=UPI001FB9664C|nr:pro-resilin-like isoform X1 [Pieris napi]XP_047509474.1 pro-resilin-like isoform X1 [Pieris napi]XP_047509475.1 pro-resilin-like isoform X1 [Pieris napi]
MNMKVKVLVAVLLSAYTMAEPPVGDYPYPDYAAQRSLSDTYGPPSFGARTQNQLTQTYGPPESQNARLSKQYLPAQRSLSQEYGVPRNFDSFEYSDDYVPQSQYGVPSARSGESYNSEKTLSQEYGLPASNFNAQEEYSLDARNLPQEYDVAAKTLPSTRLSQKYGSPARTIDTSVRDLTRQYGVPKSRSQNIPKSQFPKTRVSQVSNSFGVSQNIPTSRIQDFNVAAKSIDSSFPSDSYGAPLQRSFDTISKEYGVPQTEKPAFRSQSISQTYGVPRSGSDSYSKMSRFGAAQNTVSTSYGVPRLSSQYDVPSGGRSIKPSETYGVPNAKSFDDARVRSNAFPSSTAYLPPTREAMPTSGYGVPDVNSGLSGQGYSYARNALDELINQEPANYDFGYKVNDLRTGSDFGHTETRQENKAEGSYFVVLPDGTKQVVEYEADDQGFRPRISIEAVDLGYDENASNLAKSGPY